MNERNIEETIHILQNDGYLKNDQLSGDNVPWDSRVDCMVNFLMKLYRIKVPRSTREWISTRLQWVKIEGGKCMVCCYCWGRRSYTPKSFYRCMEELISAVRAENE